MAAAKQNFFSIVLVGRPNPQILNHEFLVQNGVLPKHEPFFRDLKEGESPFTEFFSTPPMAQITYEKYSLLVREDRYQAMDTTGSDPCTSPMIAITKRYFGDLLKYTPFNLGGVNLNCDLVFESQAEMERLDAALGIERDRTATAFEATGLTMNITATFPFENGRIMVVVAKPKDATKPTKLNFNHEFEYPGSMEAFLSRLDDVKKVVDYRSRFCERMQISI